mmetsp:Transcript_6231/g.17446  ORF Transcript_6231/g.17446 Transcript_6231/m.17446 type:complete len:490 (+) Transcript_6231:215-1684(+)|eukprot:CAMPEP_0181057728 /NCGR_PEP_ID=MMETSP1070-20121207/20406_1 /TAXON_ID=265543 /ORGANISM="Minutocellus polymorphus, Strain NH13" /LENGTH=489 /DNA_ID=CAMNT_0023137163 /DNA_START=142 /DNA_END=1611 /DNA_ORIENTATION=-
MPSSAAMFLSATVLMAFAMDRTLVLGQEYECLPLVWEVDTTNRSPTCSNFLPSARCCEGLSCESLIGCYPNPRQKGHPCSLNKPCTGDRCCAEGLACEVPATPIKPNTGLCVALKPPTLRPTTPLPTTAPTRRPTLAPSPPPTSTPTKFPTSKPTPIPTSAPSLRPNQPPTTRPTRRPTRQPSRSPTTTAPVSSSPTQGPSISPVRAPTTKEPSQAPATASPTMQPSSRPTPSPTASPTITLSPTDHPTTAIFANRSNDFAELIYFTPEIVGSGWRSWNMGPFGRCAGDCDDNSDCMPGLICFQRTGFENATVPGCAGTAEEDVDYCYDPSYQPPSAAPSPISRENLALGRPAFQSSTCNGGSANRAVDGNKTSPYFSGGSISETCGGESDPNPWWYVDLGAPKIIEKIVLWNRLDPGFSNELVRSMVSLHSLNDATISKPISSKLVWGFGVKSFFVVEFYGGKEAQVVRITKPQGGVLSLQEVEVMGY